MKKIGAGEYVPLYGVDSLTINIKEFYLDVYPVTNQQFSDFLTKHEKWNRSKILTLFANGNYLSNWKSDTSFGEKLNSKSPVTDISWYVAKAYCKSQGKRLPTVDEWEYVAMASEDKKNAHTDSLFNQRILTGYEVPKTYAKKIGSTFKNYWGIYDLHGLVWEWTSDFNSVLITGESRQDVDEERSLFCAGGAVNATDLMNYAAFIRYAFRSSVKANYCVRNLGFRCAKDIR